MRTLLVGAGAVGRVLGWHLQQSGVAQVTFLVRPEHAGGLAQPLIMRPVGRAPGALSGFDVITSPREAAGRGWDQVILCVSSPALRRGEWLRELASAAPGATFVGVQPGLEDPAFVAARVGGDRLAWGMFPLMSWAAGDPAGADTAYWRPPLQALPFSGPRDRVRPLVGALRRGGLPARLHRDVPRALAFAGPLLELHVVALECAGFDLQALAADDRLLTDVHVALGEALAVAARHLELRAPLAPRLVRPWLSRLLLRLAPRLVPFDLEGYLRRHYTKVGEQTVAGMRRSVALAVELSLPHDGLDRLLARLVETRPCRN